jgi:DNA (cytosine-5)-methyltransferase 1
MAPSMSRFPARSGTHRGSKRRVLDLFCKAGGASYGYFLGGCEVVGVDIEWQPRYPFTFIQADALTFPLDGFDLIHASPPCQAYSVQAHSFRLHGKVYPDLIAAVRERLIASGIPWVIENVPGSPLIDPVMLCGAMFGLRVYRHRLFESSFRIEPPGHPEHYWRTTDKAGQVPLPGQFRTVAGSLSDTDGARADMSISWMTGAELSQAIPPAYTLHIARQDGTRQCAQCGRWWSPARAHARTCSARCRKALSRSREAVNGP